MSPVGGVAVSVVNFGGPVPAGMGGPQVNFSGDVRVTCPFLLYVKASARSNGIDADSRHCASRACVESIVEAPQDCRIVSAESVPESSGVARSGPKYA